MSRALLTIVATAGVTACAGDSAGPPALRETLPNGALLVRYPDLPAIDDTVPEVIEAHVDLRFGSLEGDDPNLIFGDIRGVQAASDGTIYVLDYQATEVRALRSRRPLPADGRTNRRRPGRDHRGQRHPPRRRHAAVDERPLQVRDHRRRPGTESRCAASTSRSGATATSGTGSSISGGATGGTTPIRKTDSSIRPRRV